MSKDRFPFPVIPVVGVVMLAALIPATAWAETARATSGQCVPAEVRRDVMACTEGSTGPMATRNASSKGSRVVTRQGTAIRQANAGPTVSGKGAFTPTLKAFVSQRQNATGQILIKQMELTQRLIDNTHQASSNMPNIRVRLAQIFDDLARLERSKVRALDQPIFIKRQQGEDRRAKRLEQEQEEHENQEVRWRVKAVKQYRRVAQDFPQYPNRDEVLFRVGFTLEELANGERLRAEYPDRAAGQSSRERQLRTQARHAYQQLIREHPTSSFVPHAYLSFAEYYFQEGNMNAALRLYDRVLQTPNSQIYGFALYKRAWVHINLQHDREAVSDFVQVIQHSAGDPSAPMAGPLRVQHGRS